MSIFFEIAFWFCLITWLFLAWTGKLETFLAVYTLISALTILLLVYIKGKA